MSNRKVQFFKVQTNSDKLFKIITTSQFHFDKKIPLTILVPNEKVQEYIDELLWKSPPSSFLPHGTDDLETVQIKVFSNNVSYQKHIFNLCPFEILPSSFISIYDFEDPTKQYLYKQKIKFYQENKIPIESH